MGALAEVMSRSSRPGGWDRAAPDLAGPDWAGPTRAGPDLAGPDLAGPDWAGRGWAERGSAGRRDGVAGLFGDGAVRSAREIGADGGVLSDEDLFPVLPALRDLLPHGALQRGSVVSASGWNLLCLALAAGPVLAGAWCTIAGIPEFGVAAAADAGVDPARLLLVPDLGPNWPQVVASLLDGCELVVLRPPDRPAAHLRRKLEAAVRRYRAVLLVAGDWEGSQVRLRIAEQEWAGIGAGHGRLRARLAQVVADGRGGWSRSRGRWLWLPGPDGAIASADDDAAPMAGWPGLPRAGTG